MSPENSKLKSETSGRGTNDALGIVRLLTKRKQTLALAESCTGGFIANEITNVPGASKIFRGGIVAYSNEAKQKFLGVRVNTLLTRGAVSQEVAGEMARGARKHFGADFAIAVTGIAGPAGGTKNKPTGTVFIALASPSGISIERKLNAFERKKFKKVTAQQALELLRTRIERKKLPHRSEGDDIGNGA